MTSNRSLTLFLIFSILVAIVLFFNQLISVWYHVQIAPKGEYEVEKLVDEINTTDSIFEKLKGIAKWEAENIDYVYGIEPFFSFGNFAFYLVDGKPKIRALGNPDLVMIPSGSLILK